MILYCCQTNYHLLECITHRLNYNKDKEAVLIYHNLMPSRYGINEAQLQKIFSGTYGYPIKGFSSSWTPANIKAAGDKIFTNMFGHRLEEYEEIFIAGNHLWFGVYATLCGIPYNYIEDACYTYWSRDEFLKVMYKRNTSYGKILDQLEIASAENPCIKKIYTNIPPEKDYSDSRIVPYDVSAELKSLNAEQRSTVYKVYGIDEKACSHVKESDMLLLTNPFNVYDVMSISEQKYLFALIVDYHRHGNRICVKPHPSDLVDYKKIFPDAYVLPRIFPIELILADPDCGNIFAMSIFSAATNFFKYNMSFEVDVAHSKFLLSRLHLYNAIKEIYNSFEKDWRLYVQSSIPQFFSAVGIEIENDISNIMSSEENVFIVNSDGRIDIDWVDRVLKERKVIFCFDCMSWQMADLVSRYSEYFMVKELSIKKTNDDGKRKERLFFLTNDSTSMEWLRKFYYKKILNYAGEVVEMDSMSEQEAEQSALEGILAATEKRLQQVLEENEMLKAQLEEAN